MNEQITLDDFPGNEANCATCTRKGGPCPRSETKRYPNGYVVSGVTRAVSGIIYKCPNYTGPYEVKSIHAIEAEFDKWISGVKKTPQDHEGRGL